MGTFVGNPAAVLPAASRGNPGRVFTSGLFRSLADHWVRHCEKTVESDIRWLGHAGVLADFIRASHG